MDRAVGSYHRPGAVNRPATDRTRSRGPLVRRACAGRPPVGAKPHPYVPIPEVKNKVTSGEWRVAGGKWPNAADWPLITPATVDRNGLADTSVRFAVNLLGAPPLAGKEFAEYRAKTDSETIVGVGLVLQLPTGQYYDDKLINLGNNRFAFRPQLGVVHNFGKWSGELP